LSSAKERFITLRRSLPRTPRLERETTRTRSAGILSRLRRDSADWRTRLRALSAPTLVIHGEEDAPPLAVSAASVALLPRAQRQLVPQSGHMPFREAPDVFFAVVDSFFAAPFVGAVRHSV